MNAFRVMQKRLLEEGWYVGWNEPCCQSCAWSCLPDYLGAKYNDEGDLVHPETGKKLSWDERDEVYQEVDYSKVLFNHSQDCEIEIESEDCKACDGYGGLEPEDDDGDYVECEECHGEGYIDQPPKDVPPEDIDSSVEGFTCYTPEASNGSLFCFDGSKKGVKNFKAIIPIIEECGVTVSDFDELGHRRIELSWE